MASNAYNTIILSIPPLPTDPLWSLSVSSKVRWGFGIWDLGFGIWESPEKFDLGFDLRLVWDLGLVWVNLSTRGYKRRGGGLETHPHSNFFFFFLFFVDELSFYLNLPR